MPYTSEENIKAIQQKASDYSLKNYIRDNKAWYSSRRRKWVVGKTYYSKAELEEQYKAEFARRAATVKQNVKDIREQNLQYQSVESVRETVPLTKSGHVEIISKTGKSATFVTPEQVTQMAKEDTLGAWDFKSEGSIKTWQEQKEKEAVQISTSRKQDAGAIHKKGYKSGVGVVDKTVGQQAYDPKARDKEVYGGYKSGVGSPTMDVKHVEPVKTSKTFPRVKQPVVPDYQAAQLTVGDTKRGIVLATREKTEEKFGKPDRSKYLGDVSITGAGTSKAYKTGVKGQSLLLTPVTKAQKPGVVAEAVRTKYKHPDKDVRQSIHERKAFTYVNKGLEKQHSVLDSEVISDMKTKASEYKQKITPKSSKLKTGLKVAGTLAAPTLVGPFSIGKQSKRFVELGGAKQLERATKTIGKYSAEQYSESFGFTSGWRSDELFVYPSDKKIDNNIYGTGDERVLDTKAYDFNNISNYQKEGSSYKINKLNNYFHLNKLKVDRYLNFFKKGAKLSTGLGLGMISKGVEFTGEAIKHPYITTGITVGTIATSGLASAGLARVGFTSAARMAPSIVGAGVAVGFTGLEVAKAPTGQKIRTGLEVGGLFLTGAAVSKGIKSFEVETIGEYKTVGVKVGKKGYPIASYRGRHMAEVSKIVEGKEIFLAESQTKELPFKVPKIKRGIEFGTPEIKTEIKGFEQPRTATGTRVFEKNIKQFIKQPTEMLVEGKEISPELQQEFAVKGTSALRELSNVRSKYFSKEALVEMGTKRMTPAEAKVVYEGIGKKGGKVFGSFASRAELKPELWREVGDIEGMFSIESEAVLQSTVKDIFGNLKKVSKSKLRIDPESPFHIEKFTEGKWEKIAEFKGKGIGEGDVAPERAFGFDLWSKKDFQKRLGTSSAMVRGELKRKAAASIGVRQDRALGVAHKGRFKDVPDYFRHVETLAESKKGFTPKAREFLKLKEKLGIEYGTGKAKFEILPSRRVSPSIKFSKIPFVKYYSSKKSPIPSKKQPTQLSPSPSMRPSKSPSFKSPSRFISPSPSMRPSRSPSISPSRKASPSFKSPFSPSRRSPYTSPNKYISPSRKGSPSRKASPSLSPSPSMSPYLSPSPSVSPYVSPSVTSYYSYFTTKKTDDEITLIPDIELPRLERKEKKKKKPKQEFRYTPSVSAITFKIFGKAPKRITGLEQRAIVRGGKKNGKRSRKKSRSKGQRKRTDKVGIHGIRFRRLI